MKKYALSLLRDTKIEFGIIVDEAFFGDPSLF
jgi:hypothetical protein